MHAPMVSACSLPHAASRDVCVWHPQASSSTLPRALRSTAMTVRPARLRPPAIPQVRACLCFPMLDFPHDFCAARLHASTRAITFGTNDAFMCVHACVRACVCHVYHVHVCLRVHALWVGACSLPHSASRDVCVAPAGELLSGTCTATADATCTACCTVDGACVRVPVCFMLSSMRTLCLPRQATDVLHSHASTRGRVTTRGPATRPL
jgi:hypothetical protein